MTPCQKLLKQEGTARRIESMQQSSATPSLHLWFLGVEEDCCMLSILLAVPSCFNSFWHGVIPTFYFIINNNTQKAALAKLPLTTHPHERAEPHTLQTQFTPACTTWPSPLPCETPDLPDLPTLPPTPATGPRSPISCRGLVLKLTWV